MKKMNIYDLYMDDGHSTFKVTVPATSVKSAKEYVQGNGDVVAVKPSELQDIDLDCLADTLKRAQWGSKRLMLSLVRLHSAGLPDKPKRTP